LHDAQAGEAYLVPQSAGGDLLGNPDMTAAKVILAGLTADHFIIH
jgi:hypothetical protein